MKKALLMIIVIMVTVSGCGVNVDSKSTTVPKLMEMTVEYADGSTQKREYIYAPTASWPATSCVLYENSVMIGQEDYSYDDRYNTTKIIQHWDGGSTQVFELTYGENDLMSSKTVFLNGVEEYTITYTYDASNQIVEMKEFRDDALFQYTQIEYDENGHRQTQTLFDSTGEILCYFGYSFNEKESTEIVNEYSADGVLVKYLINHYNAMGVVAIEEAFNPDDSLISYTTWKYIPQQMAVTVIGYQC